MPSDTGHKRNEVALLQPSRLPWNPVFAERYGVDPAAWKALVEAVFPSAQTADSVALALSYCKARRLDPFKRVVHIVPTWDEENRRYTETVWPGIAEHRTTAMRTGLYAGADPAEYGPIIEKTFSGKIKSGPVEAKLKFPEWCQVTVYRLASGQRVPVPGPRVYWEETFSGMGRSGVPNARWQRAPYQMIEKCAEAAALRRAFPEELGDEQTADEGRYTIDASQPEPLRARDIAPNPPRGAAITHQPEPEPSYAVIDADGEQYEYDTADEATRALVAAFDEAARRGPNHLAAARENNAHIIAEFGDPYLFGPDAPNSNSPAGTRPQQPTKEDHTDGGYSADALPGPAVGKLRNSTATNEQAGEHEMPDLLGGKPRAAKSYRVTLQDETAAGWGAWHRALTAMIESGDPPAAILRDNKDNIAIFEQIDAMKHNLLMRELEAK